MTPKSYDLEISESQFDFICTTNARLMVHAHVILPMSPKDEVSSVFSKWGGLHSYEESSVLPYSYDIMYPI